MEAAPTRQALTAGTRAVALADGPDAALPEPGGLVFPGSFDPLHEGHLLMARVAEETAERPVAYELSVTNVDKSALDYVEIRHRTAQFGAQALWLTRAATVLLKAVAKIVADRETVYEAKAKGGGAAQLRGQRARAAFEKQQAESRERMQGRGVSPWPALTADDHAAELAELRAFVKTVTESFPALQVTETHEFLVATDIPPAEIGPYVATLDRMHDFLCDFYGIPKGEPVWKGKCLVVAFLNEDDFVASEGRFMQNEARGAHGLCHQRTDGRVIMSCHRGPDAAAFGHMLVHETSHGFNFRWLSPVRLPNWLNEGIAEWVGTKVVPHCNQVPLKEARALEFLRSRGDLGPEFLTRDNIDAVQSGIASGMVTFLAREPAKFAAFVRSIKEGMPMAESLKQAYGVSVEEFVAAYGHALGVPHLRP